MIVLSDLQQRNFDQMEYAKLNQLDPKEPYRPYRCEKCGSYGTDGELPYYTNEHGLESRYCKDCAEQLGYVTDTWDMDYLHKRMDEEDEE